MLTRVLAPRAFRQQVLAAEGRAISSVIPKSAGLSRRVWLRYTAAGLGLLALPVIRYTVRRRRRGEAGPTGWFGHC